MRYQLPVRSPLGAAAILSGVRAALSFPAGLEARESVLRGLRDRFGASRVILTDSGTSALSLAIRALDGHEGRPVALPAYGCYDLATATLGAGTPFLLYDVDPATLGPEPASLRRALAAGADRIVVAHLYGIPVDMRAVREIAAPFGASIIDDAAQGTGASVDARPLGTWGAAGILSFGRGKGVTGGGGGALLWSNDAAAVMPPELDPAGAGRGSPSELIKLVAQWILGRPSLYGIPSALPFLGLGETTFRAPHPASGPSALSMGVLLRSLTLVAQDANVRRANASRLAESLRGRDLLMPSVASGTVPGYLRFPVIVSGAQALAAASPAARRLGIMRGYPTALCDLKGFGEARANPGESCPGARSLAQRLITLPTHAALDARDLARLVEWMRA